MIIRRRYVGWEQVGGSRSENGEMQNINIPNVNVTFCDGFWLSFVFYYLVCIPRVRKIEIKDHDTSGSIKSGKGILPPPTV